MSVIVSNGFNRFHMAVAAASLARTGALSLFVTGAYPTPGLRRAARYLPRRAFGKLLGRNENVPDDLVRPLWWTELPHLLGQTLERRFGRSAFSQALLTMGMRSYGRAACRIVREGAARGARIYHFRAGYGGASLREARRLGLITVCDHSAVHPALFEYTGVHGGAFPASPLPPPADAFWAAVQSDIDEADIVLVNSDFVRETFAFQKFDLSKVRVIYLGIDEQFLSRIPSRPVAPASVVKTLHLLFAGAFSKRKGAIELLEALAMLPDLDWQLSIVGQVDADIRTAYAAPLTAPRICELGWIARDELAVRMTEADIFVFPSLGDGSARVVFEALACGCYVVTTPNAGSIVRDGIHGALVPPGVPDALADALRKAASNRQRLLEIGAENARLIYANYGQTRYGEQLADLYHSLTTSPG